MRLLDSPGAGAVGLGAICRSDQVRLRNGHCGARVGLRCCYASDKVRSNSRIGVQR